MTAPLVSIITINYNGLNLTSALLDTLPLDNPQLEVVVVDNASSNPKESLQLEQEYPQVKVIRSQQNLGFAGGNNLGVRHANGQFLFFLNNDTEFPSNGWEQLQRLICFLRQHPQVGVICPKIRFFWEDHPIQFAGYTPLSPITMRNRSIGFGEKDQGQYDTPHPTPYAHGAAMMVKRDALERAGLMPECFFLYYEELDWSMMFRRAGYEIWYDPSLTIYHKESATTGQNSPLRTYYITRNRLLFVRRNSTSFVKRWLSYAYLIFLVASRDILRHLLSRHPSHASSTLRGISHFLRGKEGKQ